MLLLNLIEDNCLNKFILFYEVVKVNRRSPHKFLRQIKCDTCCFIVIVVSETGRTDILFDLRSTNFIWCSTQRKTNIYYFKDTGQSISEDPDYNDKQ